MNPTIITVIAAIVALLIGIVAGKLIFNKDTAKLVEDAESQADRIVKEDARSEGAFSTAKVRT